MPGKVNPVISESSIMACSQVIGNDTTVMICGQSGNFQLNVTLPIIAYNIIQSTNLISNTAVSIANSSHTLSVPKTTWKSWIRQKSRHFSTGVYYKKYHKVMLGLWTFSQALFWFLFLALLFWQPFLHFFISLFLIRLVVLMLVSYSIMKKLEEKDLIFLYPLLELLFIFFNFIFIVNSIIKKKRFW